MRNARCKSLTEDRQVRWLLTLFADNFFIKKQNVGSGERCLCQIRALQVQRWERRRHLIFKTRLTPCVSFPLLSDECELICETRDYAPLEVGF